MHFAECFLDLLEFKNDFKFYVNQINNKVINLNKT